jgi:hypothetical protein
LRIYTALLKQNAEPELVREGFSWGALLFGPVWLAAHRAWIPAAISLAAYVLIVLMASPATAAILLLGAAVILGLVGHDLRRWALEWRGYLLVHVLAAHDRDDAFMRLLTVRPDLGARYQPGRV